MDDTHAIVREPLRMGFSGYQCCKEDVAEAVNAEFIEVIVGEIEPETAFEMLKAVFYCFPIERRDRCGHLV